MRNKKKILIRILAVSIGLPLIIGIFFPGIVEESIEEVTEETPSLLQRPLELEENPEIINYSFTDITQSFDRIYRGNDEQGRKIGFDSWVPQLMGKWVEWEGRVINVSQEIHPDTGGYIVEIHSLSDYFSGKAVITNALFVVPKDIAEKFSESEDDEFINFRGKIVNFNNLDCPHPPDIQCSPYSYPVEIYLWVTQLTHGEFLYSW